VKSRRNVLETVSEALGGRYREASTIPDPLETIIDASLYRRAASMRDSQFVPVVPLFLTTTRRFRVTVTVSDLTRVAPLYQPTTAWVS